MQLARSLLRQSVAVGEQAGAALLPGAALNADDTRQRRQVLRIPVSGTLTKPQLDQRVIEDLTRKFLQKAAKRSLMFMKCIVIFPNPLKK